MAMVSDGQSLSSMILDIIRQIVSITFLKIRRPWLSWKSICHTEEKVLKATGIVRRIDDLGRIVIPKEIRRTMRIREGDPLEIFLHEGGVLFKKYAPSYRGELSNALHDAAEYYRNVREDQLIAIRLNEIAKEIQTLLAEKDD